MNNKLILASASPRRKELLDQLGVNYRVHIVDIDETPKPLELPRDYVCRVASEKSAACLSEINPTAKNDERFVILAADTSVIINNKILGKPTDQADAESMLNLLSGKTHQVMTAVSLRTSVKNEKSTHYDVLSVTDVSFRAIESKEIECYWETGEPQGKAGAYAIQGLASVFVESIKGSYSGVMGLPLFETAKLLSKQGIRIIT